MTCIHRWILEPNKGAAHGVCFLCGDERDFTGGGSEADAYARRGRYGRPKAKPALVIEEAA